MPRLNLTHNETKSLKEVLDDFIEEVGNDYEECTKDDIKKILMKIVRLN